MRRSRILSLRSAPWIIGAIGILLSGLSYDQLRRFDDGRVHAMLDLRAELRVRDIQRKIDGLINPLNQLAVLLDNQRDITRDDFQRFAQRAHQEVAPVNRLSWLPRVPREELAKFETAQRAGGAADFRVVERRGDDLVPAEERSEYFPVLYDASFDGTVSERGLDAASDPMRRDAMMQAADAGESISSEPLRLGTASDPQPNYVVFLPVYRGGTAPRSVGERRAKLAGFVAGSLRFATSFDAATRDAPLTDETLRVYMGRHAAPSESEPPIVLYLPSLKRFVAGSSDAALAAADSEVIVKSFREFGQPWTLALEIPAAAAAQLRAPVTFVLPAIGLLLTALLVAYVLAERRRWRHAESESEARNSALSRSSEELSREKHGRATAETELARASVMLERIVEASPMAIVCLAPNRRVIIWNRAAERIFGYGAEEAIGRPYPLVPPEGREEFDRLFMRALAGDMQQGIEMRHQRKDGTLIDVLFSGAAVYGDGDALHGVIYELEDVTERKRVEERLTQAEKMESVGQLTGGLAHDFNNILGAVIGNLDLLEERLTHDKIAAGFAKASLDAALAGAELVKRLLAFSRRQPLKPARTDLKAAIREFLPLMRRTLGEQVRIECSITNDVWPVMTDAVQLESAVLNLAVNARDAMPYGGTVRIDCRNLSIDDDQARHDDDLESGDYVVVTVTDSGTGMTPEVMAHAFEPFFTTKPQGAGTGLGLSMVFGYAKQSGGTVQLNSEQGKGTTVRLYLPRAVDEEGAALPPEEILSSDPTGSERILYVEDNPQIRKMGEAMLRKLGYRVAVAQSADAALELFARDGTFDMLFSDIVMPGRLNGAALGRELRTRNPKIKILLATGFASPTVARDKLAALGAHLITKPYRRSELARTLRQILDGP
ncbi:MAG: CHASE domain-containing protein [Alphaproteobacteria bacterium]